MTLRARCTIAITIACAVSVACADQPTASGPGAPTHACEPLAESGASVTSAGLTPDGHYVVVVSRAGGARVFYGVVSHMVEGVVTAMHPSCATEVDFDLAGRSEVAVLSPGPPACALASTLTSGNAGDAIVVVPLTVVVPAVATSGSALPSLAFFCL